MQQLYSHIGHTFTHEIINLGCSYSNWWYLLL